MTLASLLAPLERRESVRLPFIEVLVFCSAAGLGLRLPPNLAMRVFVRDRRAPDGTVTAPGTAEALANPDFGPRRTDRPVDRTLAQALVRMLGRGGICRARSVRRVAGYKLATRQGEGPLYEDFLASHPTLPIKRRVRLFPYPPQASQELRQTTRRAAVRDTRDWARLCELVQLSLPGLAGELPRTGPPALLTSAGMLARYGQVRWVSDLALQCGRVDGLHGAWLLVPWKDPGQPPTIDGGGRPRRRGGRLGGRGAAWAAAGRRGRPRGGLGGRGADWAATGRIGRPRGGLGGHKGGLGGHKGRPYGLSQFAGLSMMYRRIRSRSAASRTTWSW